MTCDARETGGSNFMHGSPFYALLYEIANVFQVSKWHHCLTGAQKVKGDGQKGDGIPIPKFT
jgi:hypothetical protein